MNLIPDNPSFGWRVSYILLSGLLLVVTIIIQAEIHYCL